MKAQFTLTSAESKRLIAKAVAQMDIVKKALKNGIILIARGTTNAFVAEELLRLLGEEFKKDGFSSGIVTPIGACGTREDVRQPEVAIIKGQVHRGMTISKEIIKKMDKDDVFIKGANALDPEGNAAIFFGHPTGVALGAVILAVMNRGINWIIPVGLEKLIPIPVRTAAKEAGINQIDYSMGIPVGLLPVTGTVINEVDAIRILCGAEAIPIGAGGIGGAEGAVTLIVKGTEKQVKKAIEILEKIKGEKPVKAFVRNCSECWGKNLYPRSTTCYRRNLFASSSRVKDL